MQRYRLTENVVVEGSNARGVQSTIELWPLARDSGWHWHTPNSPLVPVTPDIMEARRRCVALVKTEEDDCSGRKYILDV